MKTPEYANTPFVPRRQYNELVDCVKWLLQNALVSAGAGLEVRVLPQGRAVGLSTTFGDEGNVDDPIQLTFSPTGAPAEDTWAREDDECAVEIKWIEGIKYDNDLKRLQLKTRTALFDNTGALYSISAESAWIDIVQFVPHPT